MPGREYVTEVAAPDPGDSGRVAMYSPGLPPEPLPEPVPETEGRGRSRMSTTPEPVAEIDGVPQYAQATWEGKTIIADTAPEIGEPEPEAS